MEDSDDPNDDIDSFLDEEMDGFNVEDACDEAAEIADDEMANTHWRRVNLKMKIGKKFIRKL